MTEKNKGLVMSVSPGGEVTVMTPQGEFLNITLPAREAPELGSEIEFKPPVVRKPVSSHGRRFFTALAASIILLLLGAPLWSQLSVPGPQQVIAYVAVDINPSIELGINYQGKVLEAIGLNDDGVKLLEKVDLTGLPVNQAVSMITAQAVKENYITPEKENSVLISVSTKKELPESAKNLEQHVKKVLEQEKIAVEAEAIEVPMKIREMARKEKVSPGKYVILIEAVEEGLDLSIEDVKGSSIVKAVKAAGGTPGQLISKAKQDRNKMKDIVKNYEKKVKEQIKNDRKNNGRDKDKESEEKREPEKDNDNRGNENRGRDSKDRNNRDNKDDQNKDDDDRNNGNRNDEQRGNDKKDQENRAIDSKDRENRDDDDRDRQDRDSDDRKSRGQSENNKPDRDDN